jgi:hypothetical protein
MPDLGADTRPYREGLEAVIKAVARFEKSIMPYSLRKVQGGYKVYGPNGPKSQKPLPKARAEAQLRALYANEPKAKKKG